MRRALLCALIALGGCRGAYYSTLEKFGVHKRDILVDRVEEHFSNHPSAIVASKVLAIIAIVVLRFTS